MTLLGLAIKLRKVEQSVLAKPDDDGVVLELAPKHRLPEGALGHQRVEASKELGVHLEGLVFVLKFKGREGTLAGTEHEFLPAAAHQRIPV
jgi:hypothetical protein